MSIHLNAGDIIASEGTRFSSRIIQLFTRSKWSHVGIVTPEGKILEATKAPKKNDQEKEIRPVSLSEFLEDTASVIVFRRHNPMTEQDKSNFQKASTETELRKYAFEQAIFSNALPTIQFGLLVYFGWPILLTIYYIFTLASSLNIVLNGLVILSILIGSWVFLSILFNWAYTCQWGKQSVQEFYKKSKLGSCIVDRENNDMFCSKLVANFDELSGGDLKSELKLLNDARPIDVVMAARKIYFGLGEMEGPIKSQKWWSKVVFWLRR